MMYLLRLAFKNILRSKIRTVLTFLILAFGVGLYILMACLMAGFDVASMQNIIDFETGDFKLRQASFNEDEPYELKNYLGDYQAIEQKLKALPFVRGLAERVQFLAEIDNSRDSAPVVAVGVGPQDGRVFSLEKYITDGRLEKNGVVLGQSLAKDLRLRVGDLAYLTLRDQQGMYTSAELTVTGLVHSANPLVDSTMVFINLDEAQRLLNTTQVSEIALKTDDFEKVGEYEPKIRAAVPEVKVYSWKRLSEDYTALMSMKRKAQGILLLMIMIIAVVGIVNTLLISVFEKKREIGTMKALGFTDREVRNLFLLEGLLIGLAGGLLGWVLGTLFNSYFYFAGFDLNAMMGEDQNIGFPVMGVVKSVWLLSAYVKAMVFALLASAVASYYPARKVTQMEPMECLRTVQ